jgi:hypothetical protein
MRQEYSCGECGLESHVDLVRGLDEDALKVLEMIDKDHNKWSPDRGATAERVRLFKSLIVEGEWPHTLEAGMLN